MRHLHFDDIAPLHTIIFTQYIWLCTFGFMIIWYEKKHLYNCQCYVQLLKENYSEICPLDMLHYQWNDWLLAICHVVLSMKWLVTGYVAWCVINEMIGYWPYGMLGYQWNDWLLAICHVALSMKWLVVSNIAFDPSLFSLLVM